MFSKLPALPNLSPNQTKQAQALAKNFSARKKTDLEKADKLLFDLFIADNAAAVAICLDVLTAIPFNGNFDLWTFVEPAHTLKYFLSADAAEKAAITRMLTDDVRSKWDDDEEHREAKQKILDGEQVDDALDELERYGKTPAKEYVWRKFVLQAYLLVWALGATGKLNPSSVSEKIEENICRLKELAALPDVQKQA